MTIVTEDFTYDAGGVTMAAHLAWDDAVAGRRPGVLIAPSVRGPTPFEQETAARLAALGYAAMVIDMYGTEARAADGADNYALMNALNADRRLLHSRLSAGYAVLLGLEQVERTKTAALGYCFGGKCVLDLARTRAEVLGVAPFHGLFDPPPFETLPTIAAKVLALHGWDDPLATPEEVKALADELTAKGADWQIHAYGHAGHGFTYPPANDRDRGIFYEPRADRRSWAALTGFLDEIFG